MGKIQEIERLAASIDDLVVADESQICCYLFQTRHLVFLDTCFVTHQGGYPRQPEVYEALGELCGGTDAKDVVFALTETVLYEMMQHDTGEIYEQSEQFLRGLKESGFTIVLIKEENVLHMVMPYVQRNAAEWNDFFVQNIRSNKAAWTAIVGKTKNPACRFYDVFSSSHDTSVRRDFIHDFIVELKEHKTTRDSLAEELIFLYILFLRVLLGDAKKKSVWFFSDDLPALVRMNQIFGGLAEGEHRNYEGIHSFQFVQYMRRLGKIESKQELQEYLSGFMSEKLIVLVEKEPPFQAMQEVKSLEECAELIVEEHRNLTLVGRG